MGERSNEQLYRDEAHVVFQREPNTIGVYRVAKNVGYAYTDLHPMYKMVDASTVKSYLASRNLKVCWYGVSGNLMDSNFDLTDVTV